LIAYADAAPSLGFFLTTIAGLDRQRLNGEKGRRQQQQEQAEMKTEETADERTN
jgi:hypothetical protein